MQRIQLSDSLSMSRIVYGMWRLGDDSDTSVAHVTRKIESCLDQGITTLDQADIYGAYTAEAILGEALKANPSLRSKVEIVTKCDIVAPIGRHSDARVKYYDTSRAYILSAVEQSLRDMHIDEIDLLLIHRPDPLMDHKETGAALDELVKSGKVRNVGVSNFRPWDWQLLQSGMSTPLVTNQIELSLQAHEGFVNGDVAFHQQHDHAMMAWSPLAGGELINQAHPVHGTLSAMANRMGTDVASVAVAWLLAHPSKILPVLGTNNLERIANLARACELTLDRQDWYELYTAALGREVA
ncbi:MAG: aldo/keto reductase [Gammaproteobacteria bacterium]|nr:aldo/keto reductase [Gammaproteobacteria bacterium]